MGAPTPHSIPSTRRRRATPSSGSRRPVRLITDGEQWKYHSFWTYCVEGLPNTAPDGFKIPFAAGHVRRMPRLTGGPFRYRLHADRSLNYAPFCDDRSTTRDTAFAKIRARVLGTELASRIFEG